MMQTIVHYVSIKVSLYFRKARIISLYYEVNKLDIIYKNDNINISKKKYIDV